jgi:hypothetical protein
VRVFTQRLVVDVGGAGGNALGQGQSGTDIGGEDAQREAVFGV